VRSRLATLAILLALAAFAVFTLGGVPFNDWLDQRASHTALVAQVEEIERLNHEYELRIDALNTDEEIERRARADYNLVRFDEEAYAVLPPPPAAHRIQGVWPFGT
jgi:cell division protein FtsB